jgi:predicted transcriptional regulator YdeE
MGIMKILSPLFAHGVQEPRVVVLEQPIKIMGMGIETDVRSVYRDVPRLGKRFERYKKAHDIPNKKEPWAFAAVSKDFDEVAQTFLYIMGDVVTSFDQVPSDLTAFEIPAGTYAVFSVQPKNRFGWAVGIVNAKRYAYETWLPASGYEPAGTIDDFEYHDERSTRKKNPEIELYVAIKRKS